MTKKFGRGSRGPRKQYTPDALKALRDMVDGLSGVQASIKWGIPKSTLIDLKKGSLLRVQPFRPTNGAHEG